MSKVTVSIALEHYNRTVPFLEQGITSDKLEINLMVISHADRERRRHARMIHDLEFDVCELSLSSYIMAKASGCPVTAIPIFPRRMFSQSQIYVNVNSGIKEPQDLIGRVVGLHAYQTTLSVLAKGDLCHEYGVPLEQITWITTADETVPFDAPTGLSIMRLANDKDLGEELLAGRIPAFIAPRPPAPFITGSRDVIRLFHDSRREEIEYFTKHGFFPVMHVIAVKEALLAKYEWLGVELFRLFTEAKVRWNSYDNDPNWSNLAWGPLWRETEKSILGDDPWPYGISKNRKNLRTLIQYAYEQGLIPQTIHVDDLFHHSMLMT
jgi:4,5-dihydroxyphthalate decarboxylase